MVEHSLFAPDKTKVLGAESSPEFGHIKPQPIDIAALILVFIFALFRVTELTRELTYEEPTWISQGLTFLNTGKFTGYFGILDPAGSGFHKPPLLSLLMGSAAKFVGPTTISYRLVPFILGTLSFYLWIKSTRILGGSIFITSVLAAVTPFLFVGMNHIQTDGTVGLFGFSLLIYVCLRGVVTRAMPTIPLLFAGFWLAFSKTEIFVFGSIPVALAGLVSGGLRGVIKYLLIYALGLLPSTALICAMSLMTYGTISGFFEIYQTILRIVTPLVANKIQSTSIDHAFLPSNVISTQLATWHVFEIVALGATSLCVVMLYLFTKRLEGIKALCVLAMFIAPPLLVYLFVGYSGDGFPRYYLIIIPPCLMAISLLRRVGPLKYLLAPLVLGYSAFFIRPLSEIYTSKASFTGFRGAYGSESAGVYLKEILPPNSLILSPDPVGFYYGGPYFDISMTQPYPKRWADFISSDYRKIRAWVYFAEPGSLQPTDSDQKKLLHQLNAEGIIAKTSTIGTLGVVELSNRQSEPIL